MSKNALQKHTMNFYAGDFDRLSEFYPRAGASVVIREIIHKFIADIEAKQDKASPVALSTDITIKIEEDLYE